MGKGQKLGFGQLSHLEGVNPPAPLPCLLSGGESQKLSPHLKGSPPPPPPPLPQFSKFQGPKIRHPMPTWGQFRAFFSDSEFLDLRIFPETSDKSRARLSAPVELHVVVPGEGEDHRLHRGLLPLASQKRSVGCHAAGRGRFLFRVKKSSPLKKSAFFSKKDGAPEKFPR